LEPFEVQDPHFEQRVRDSFCRQPFMAHLGAELHELRPGFCEIRLPYRRELSQQHGYFHGGVLGTLADNAAGYASYTLMPADASILTVEYKLNILAPGDGSLLISRGTVIKPGRTLTVTQSEVYAVKDDSESLCAAALVTLMTLAGRPDH
jgi:uncharacterized protein (TIGR00369 family)